MTDTPKRIAPKEWERWYEMKKWRANVATKGQIEQSADALIAKLVAAVEERDRTIEQVGAAFSEVSKYSLSRDLKAAEMKRTLARRTARVYDDLRTENKRLMGALHHVYDTHILNGTPFEEWLEAQARAAHDREEAEHDHRG